MTAKRNNSLIGSALKQNVIAYIDSIVADFTTIISDSSAYVAIQDGIFSDQIGIHSSTGLCVIVKTIGW